MQSIKCIVMGACVSMAAMAAVSRAAVVGYYRFEGAPTATTGANNDFFDDYSGNARPLTTFAGSPAQVARPAGFPGTVLGQPNALAASFNGSSVLQASDNAAFTSNQFTLEAFIRPSAVPTGSATAAIAGQSDGGANQRGFFLGLRPGGTLRLAFSNNGTGFATRDFSAGIVAGSDYYVAASVDVTTDNSSSVTFYVQNLTAGTPLQTFNTFRGTFSPGALFNAAAPFTIGGVTSSGAISSPFSGIADEVRLSNTRLSPEELLVPEPSSLALLGLAGLELMRRRRS